MSGAAATPAPGDQARVTVGVAVPPDEAFRVFTQEVDLWWRRGRRFRHAPGDDGAQRGVVCIEPGAGGRLFESFNTGMGEQVLEIGRTLVWDPPHRLVLQWRAANFAPHEHTEVEVLFTPSPGGTTVTLVHRGWNAIRTDHPVRHGQDEPAFIRTMGLWWGDQLTMMRLRASGQMPSSDPEHSIA
ncbi:MAG: SRPBCC domain-containing protein [Chitinophagaceae bacterium]|nr:SRPBCC domain-containing protein [Rubrivivax sp.]